MAIPVGTTTSQGSVVTPNILKKKKKKEPVQQQGGQTFNGDEKRAANFISAYFNTFKAIPTPGLTREFIDNLQGMSEGSVQEYAQMLTPAKTAGMKPGADVSDQSVVEFALQAIDHTNRMQADAQKDPYGAVWGPTSARYEDMGRGEGGAVEDPRMARALGGAGPLLSPEARQKALAIQGQADTHGQKLIIDQSDDLQARWLTDPKTIVNAPKRLGLAWVNDFATKKKWDEMSPEAQHYAYSQTGRVPLDPKEVKAAYDAAFKQANAMPRNTPAQVAKAQAAYNASIKQIVTTRPMSRLERNETSKAFMDAASVNVAMNLRLQQVLPDEFKPLTAVKGRTDATSAKLRGEGSQGATQYKNAWAWTAKSQRALEVAVDGRQVVSAILAESGSQLERDALDYLAERGYVDPALSYEEQKAAMTSFAGKEGGNFKVVDPAAQQSAKMIVKSLGAKPGQSNLDLYFKMYFAGANPNMQPMQVAKEWADNFGSETLPPSAAKALATYDQAYNDEQWAQVLGSIGQAGRNVKARVAEVHADDAASAIAAAGGAVKRAVGAAADATIDTVEKVPGGKQVAWAVYNMPTLSGLSLQQTIDLEKKAVPALHAAADASTGAAGWVGKNALDVAMGTYNTAHDAVNIYLSSLVVAGGNLKNDVNPAHIAQMIETMSIGTLKAPVAAVGGRFLEWDPRDVMAYGNDLVALQRLTPEQEMRMRLMNDTRHIYATSVTLQALSEMKGKDLSELSGPIGGEAGNPTYKELFASLGSKQYFERDTDLTSSGATVVQAFGGDPAGKDKILADSLTLMVNTGTDFAVDAAIGMAAKAGKAAAAVKVARTLGKNHPALESVAGMLAKTQSKYEVFKMYPRMDAKLRALVADAKTAEDVKRVLAENEHLHGHNILPDGSAWTRYRALQGARKADKTQGFWDQVFMKMSSGGSKTPEEAIVAAEQMMQSAGWKQESIAKRLEKLLEINLYDDLGDMVGAEKMRFDERLRKLGDDVRKNMENVKKNPADLREARVRKLWAKRKAEQIWMDAASAKEAGHATGEIALNPSEYFHATGETVGDEGYTLLNGMANPKSGGKSLRVSADAKILEAGQVVPKTKGVTTTFEQELKATISRAKLDGYDAVRYLDENGKARTAVITDGKFYDAAKIKGGEATFKHLTIDDALKRGLVTEAQAWDEFGISKWDQWMDHNDRLAKAAHTHWRRTGSRTIGRAYNLIVAPGETVPREMSLGFNPEAGHMLINDLATGKVLHDAIEVADLNPQVIARLNELTGSTRRLRGEAKTLQDLREELWDAERAAQQHRRAGIGPHGDAGVFSGHAERRELIDAGWTPVYRGEGFSDVSVAGLNDAGVQNAASGIIGEASEGFSAASTHRAIGSAPYFTYNASGTVAGEADALAYARGHGNLVHGLLDPEAQGVQLGDLLLMQYGQPGSKVVINGVEHDTGQVISLLEDIDHAERGLVRNAAVLKPEQVRASIRAKVDLPSAESKLAKAQRDLAKVEETHAVATNVDDLQHINPEAAKIPYAETYDPEFLAAKRAEAGIDEAGIDAKLEEIRARADELGIPMDEKSDALLPSGKRTFTDKGTKRRGYNTTPEERLSGRGIQSRPDREAVKGVRKRINEIVKTVPDETDKVVKTSDGHDIVKGRQKLTLAKRRERALEILRKSTDPDDIALLKRYDVTEVKWTKGAIDEYAQDVEREYMTGTHRSQVDAHVESEARRADQALYTGPSLEDLERKEEQMVQAQMKLGKSRDEAIDAVLSDPQNKDMYAAMGQAKKAKLRQPKSTESVGWAEEHSQRHLEAQFAANKGKTHAVIEPQMAKDLRSVMYSRLSDDAATAGKEVAQGRQRQVFHTVIDQKTGEAVEELVRTETDAYLKDAAGGVYAPQAQFLIKRWGLAKGTPVEEAEAGLRQMLGDLGIKLAPDVKGRAAKVQELKDAIVPDWVKSDDPATLHAQLSERLKTERDMAYFASTRGFDYIDDPNVVYAAEDPVMDAWQRSLRVRPTRLGDQAEGYSESLADSNQAARGFTSPMAHGDKPSGVRVIINREKLRFPDEETAARYGGRGAVERRIQQVDERLALSARQTQAQLAHMTQEMKASLNNDALDLFQRALSDPQGAETGVRSVLLAHLSSNPELQKQAEEKLRGVAERLARVIDPKASELEKSEILAEFSDEMDETIRQLRDLAENPNAFMTAKPQWEHQTSYWSNVAIDPGQLAKFNMGPGFRNWDIAQRTRAFGMLPSIDDATRFYRNVVLAKLSTMIRIILGDEAIRLLPEKTWMNPMRTLPEEMQTEVAAVIRNNPHLNSKVTTMFDLASGAEHVSLAPNDPEYHDALAWALGHVSRDRTTTVWLKAYDEAVGGGSTIDEAADAATQRLVDLAHVPSAKGGFQEFLEDTNRIFTDLPDDVLSEIHLGGKVDLTGKMPKSADVVERWAEGITAFNKYFTGSDDMLAQLRSGKVNKGLLKHKGNTFPMVRYRVHDTYSSGTYIKNPMDVLWKAVDSTADAMKRSCFRSRYVVERKAMDAISDAAVAAGRPPIPKNEAVRLATQRANQYVDRVMFSSDKYVGEDVARNLVMFLPAYRQFAQYWGGMALKHPVAMSSVMYNLNTKIPDETNVGSLTIRPKSAIFLTGGGSFGQGGVIGMINDWGPGAAPLITVPAQFINEKFSLGLENVPGLQFTRGGNVWNAVADRVFFGITGQNLPRPFGRADDVYEALVIKKMQSLYVDKQRELNSGEMKYADLAALARSEVRKDAALEGVLKFFIPMGTSLNADQSLAESYKILTDYETLIAGGEEGKAADLILQGKSSDSRYASATEGQKLASLVLQYRALPDAKRAQFVDAHPEVLPWAVGSTKPTDPDIYTVLIDQYNAYKQKPEDVAAGWRTRAVQASGWEENQATNLEVQKREGGFVKFLKGTEWNQKHGWDAVKKGTPIYEYYRYLFEQSQGPWSNDRGLTVGGKVMAINDSEASQALNEKDLKLAGLFEKWMGPQGMSAAFREYPTVVKERQAKKLEALSYQTEVAGMGTVAMTEDHWKALGIKMDASVHSTALRLTDRWMSFYDVCERKNYKPMTTEWRELRAKTIAENNKDLAANDRTKILTKGPAAKLAFLTKPQPVDWGTPQSVSSRMPFGAQEARDNKVPAKSMKPKADKLYQEFVADTNKKNTKSAKYWNDRAAQNLTGQALVYYKEKVRAYVWEGVLMAGSGGRQALRLTYNESMKSQGTSTDSKYGKVMVKWMLQVRKIVGSYSPEFNQEWQALNKNTNLITDLLDWGVS